MSDSNRRQFLGAALAASAAHAATPTGEYRNRQPGMHYRRLGRTNLMVSEFVSGGDPIRAANWKHLDLALELGLNYLDMAPAYGQGDCEESYAKLLGGSSAKRGKVFLTTKVSNFGVERNRLYKEIFDALPAGKQAAITKRGAEMRHERGVEKPGYFIDYFPGQRAQLPNAYITNAMMKDYAHKVDGSKAFRDFITGSLEGSLRRIGTDHFDILMCPHGACCPEELEIPEILETFTALKQQGKVRFLGVTSHNDPAGVLRTASRLGHYDLAMVAYNCINGGWLEEPIREAASRGMGIIAMKAAMAVATHHKELQPVPQWRIDKIHRIIPGDMKAPMKAYLWALQNPNLTAVISNLWDETHIRENLSLAGRKVELKPA